MFLKAAREFKFWCQNQFLSFHRTVKRFHSKIIFLSLELCHLSLWNCLPWFLKIILLACFDGCCIIISSFSRYRSYFKFFILIHFTYICYQIKASNFVIKIQPHIHPGTIFYFLLQVPCWQQHSQVWPWNVDWRWKCLVVRKKVTGMVTNTSQGDVRNEIGGKCQRARLHNFKWL